MTSHWFQGPHLCKSERKFSSLLSFIDFFFMISEECQKRDRIYDDKLPQHSICAVRFSKTGITVKSFFSLTAASSQE